jgi:pimeloyl-ACP methyl ester carboxylesterase
MSMVAGVSAGLAADVRDSSPDNWRGWRVLDGGKGYAPTPMGQVHYRDIGPRDYKHPIVLMHQSPMSMIQFADIQNALAERGVRAITIDTPGFGNSDLPPTQPTIQEFAENMIYVLDHLKLDRVVIAGHHTGAQIAGSFAARHPDRVAAIVMHGAPMWTPEELAKLQKAVGGGSRTPVPDGTHLNRRFRGRNFDSNTPQKLMDALTWLEITSFITGPDIGHYAAFRYEMRPDIETIKVPGLILSDTSDAIHPIDLQVAGIGPNFKYAEFSNGNYLAFMAEPDRWAQIVSEFLATVN